MIIYKTKNVKIKAVNKVICDRCKKEIEDELELQESYSMRFDTGYSSVFGDGESISCDLCQNCLKELIGNFCRYEE